MAVRSQGDVSAFAELVAARSPALLRTAYVVVGDRLLAQDLLQEAFVKAYVAWPRLRDEARRGEGRGIRPTHDRDPMNTTLRDVIARRANDAGEPDLDIDELVALGEHRLRRRRATAVLGATAAVVAVIIAVAVGATLDGPVHRDSGPVDDPVDHHPSTLVRKIAYSDLQRNGPLGTAENRTSGPNRTVHPGDQVVRTGNGFVHLDVTDDGLVYTLGGSAWFSDGGTPERIGTHLCNADRNGEFSHYAPEV